MASQVIQRLLPGPWHPHTVLNLNLPILQPGQQPRGLRVVPVSTSPLVDDYRCHTDAQGNHNFTAATGFSFHHTPPDSDLEALLEGYMTLTPLQFDPTHYQSLHEWGRLVESR